MGRVKRLLGQRKAGYAGTLDPLASGVLPIALGQATRTIPFTESYDKTYGFTIRWGEARSTDDAEGEVIASSDMRPSREQIQTAMGQFIGDIQQVPPIYSAIKQAGRPAYARARAGEDVQMVPRQVVIRRFELRDIPDSDTACFEVDCSKGTYIRALARDLAVALGTCGYVAALRRLRCGIFGIETAIGLESLADLVHKECARSVLLPLDSVLDDILALSVTEEQTQCLRHGQPLIGSHEQGLPTGNEGQKALARGVAEGPVALLEYRQGAWWPDRVFTHTDE